ncbi:hypothetical protein EJ06DRAFT_263077 [Trichodelitschia bisporula]|uniref:Uncharacterized protein n=1 Tax=Trichodelitschia bisporula TaxID=703511 RepID=A0A6G1HIT0_9PEZI|nr:hypothetical protein EJ06DRAFT_263077 [Trichodelitschia bisporula]
MADNYGANHTCLRALSASLKTDFGVIYPAATRRLRSIGHVVNLAYKASASRLTRWP